MRRGGELRRTTPLTRGTKQLRRTGINRATPTPAGPTTSKERRLKSRRRASDFSKPAKDAMRARSGGRCEWWTGCAQQATDRAHRENRNPRNGFASNGLELCRAHHVRSHDHRREANELGVRVSDGHDYRAIPVLTRHSPRKILLDDAGGWAEAPEVAA